MSIERQLTKFQFVELFLIAYIKQLTAVPIGTAVVFDIVGRFVNRPYSQY